MIIVPTIAINIIIQVFINVEVPCIQQNKEVNAFPLAWRDPSLPSKTLSSVATSLTGVATACVEGVTHISDRCAIVEPEVVEYVVHAREHQLRLGETRPTAVAIGCLLRDI